MIDRVWVNQEQELREREREGGEHLLESGGLPVCRTALPHSNLKTHTNPILSHYFLNLLIEYRSIFPLGPHHYCGSLFLFLFCPSLTLSTIYLFFNFYLYFNCSIEIYIVVQFNYNFKESCSK